MIPEVTIVDIHPDFVCIDGVRYTYEEAAQQLPWVGHYLKRHYTPLIPEQ